MTQLPVQPSNVSDIVALLKLACDGIKDGEQIAADPSNWLLDWELGSALAGEVFSSLSDFSGAIAEAKAINLGGIEACIQFLATNLPLFGSANFSAILQSILNGIVGFESILAAANAAAPAAPAAPVAPVTPTV